MLARAGHALLDTLTVDQVDEALGDASYLEKVEAAKRVARAARYSDAKRQSTAFEPADCTPTGQSSVETLTSTGLEVSTVGEAFDQQAYFLVEGPATIFVEPRFSVEAVTGYGSFNVEILNTSCSSSQERFRNRTSVDIHTDATVGVLLSLTPRECEGAPAGLDFSLEPEEKTSDCATRTSFTFGVTLGDATSACEPCAGREYCDTEGKCVCDNYEGDCFDRDDCPAMDPGFDSDGQCHTGYNDKACCTAEGANKAVASVAASMALAGVNVEDEEYAECWQQVLRPLFCAEKCAADSSMFDSKDNIVQCKSLCEETVDLCKEFMEKANGDDAPPLNSSMCVDYPTTDCFSGATSLTVSGLVSVLSLLALW